jgi:hypothetical protein
MATGLLSPGGKTGPGVKVSTDFHLVLGLRISVAQRLITLRSSIALTWNSVPFVPYLERTLKLSSRSGLLEIGRSGSNISNYICFCRGSG